jgi:radical SAM protein with 4Fe4S-binding SPASM domain
MTLHFPPKPGIYKFDRQENGGKSRIHLRLEDNFSGVLVVNAAKMIHLNPTAGLMAWQYFNDVNIKDVPKQITSLFRTNKKQAALDYQDTVSKIEQLISEDSNACPVCDLGLENIVPFTAKLSAPYRMDLALTYRCNNNCSHCYNARERNYPELDTQNWKQIIDKLWEIGIPHLVFTGGEPTLRDDLPDLVRYAEQKGFVTGLNTNGRKLANQDFLQDLIDAGLDHVQITLESHIANIHDEVVLAKGAWQETVQGIKNVVNSKLYFMTNTTLLKNNHDYLEKFLAFTHELGIPTVGLNALIYSGRGSTVDTGLPETELPALLQIAIDHTNRTGQRLIWYTPTQYCHFDPMQLDLGIKGCTAAYYNMCIESDGQVIPCQSYYEQLGSLIDNPWHEIWNHPLSINLRERKDAPQACHHCDYFQECGGGCPLSREHQSVMPIYKDLILPRA